MGEDNSMIASVIGIEEARSRRSEDGSVLLEVDDGLSGFDFASDNDADTPSFASPKHVDERLAPATPSQLPQEVASGDIGELNMALEAEVAKMRSNIGRQAAALRHQLFSSFQLSTAVHGMVVELQNISDNASRYTTSYRSRVIAIRQELDQARLAFQKLKQSTIADYEQLEKYRSFLKVDLEGPICLGSNSELWLEEIHRLTNAIITSHHSMQELHQAINKLRTECEEAESQNTRHQPDFECTALQSWYNLETDVASAMTGLSRLADEHVFSENKKRKA